MQALAVALLPAVALHLLLAVPSGTPPTRGHRLIVGGGYLVAGGIGVLLWTDRPSLPAWPLVVEAVLAAAIGVSAVMSRYPVTLGSAATTIAHPIHCIRRRSEPSVTG